MSELLLLAVIILALCRPVKKNRVVQCDEGVEFIWYEKAT